MSWEYWLPKSRMGTVACFMAMQTPGEAGSIRFVSPQTTDAIPVRILYDSRPSHPTAAVPKAFAVASHLALAAILVTLFFRWERERLHVVFGCDPAGYLRLTQL